MTDLADIIRKRQKRAAEKTAASETKAPEAPTPPEPPPSPAKPKAKRKSGAKKAKAVTEKALEKAKTFLEQSGFERRLELFARRYLFGDPPDLAPMQATAAYRSVYPEASARAARVNSCRLMADPRMAVVLARVAAEAWQRQEVSEDEVLQGWLHTSRANVFDYFDEDKAGRLHSVPKSQLTLWQQRNVKKLKVRNEILEVDGKQTLIAQAIELEVHDPTKARDSIARYLSMFKGDLTSDSMAAIAKMIASGQERARHRAVTWDHDTGRPVFTDGEDDDEGEND